MTEYVGMSPAWVARTAVAVDELHSAEGRLWWLQSDPGHGGVRRVVQAGRSGRADFVTPAEHPVGGSLHAYGGGAFAVVAGAVWFTGTDGSLLRQPLGGRVEPVTAAGEWQYGDLAAGRD